MLRNCIDIIDGDIGAFFIFPASPIPVAEFGNKREFVGFRCGNQIDEYAPLENPPYEFNEPVAVVPVILAGEEVLKVVEFFFSEGAGVGVRKEIGE
jgi:hypothetical protein